MLGSYEVTVNLFVALLDEYGGWNEQTITDDLDLTLRLHLDGWKIDFLQFPPVEEIETALSLWHQRNRGRRITSAT